MAGAFFLQLCYMLHATQGVALGDNLTLDTGMALLCRIFKFTQCDVFESKKTRA